MKLEYQFSGRRFFDVCEASALRTALEWFGECQELISGEGVSPSLSPRRLRAKYTLRTNLRFMLRGFRPCRGQICAVANLQSERAGLYLSMPPQKAGAWMLLLWAATFLSKYAATLTGLRRSPPAAVRNRQPRTARIRAVVRSKPPYGGCSYKSGGIRLSTKGKEKGIFEKKFIYRNGKAA